MKVGDLVLAQASRFETDPEVFARIEPVLHRPLVLRSVTGDVAEVVRFAAHDDVVHRIPIKLLLPVHVDVVPRKDPTKRAVLCFDQCVLSELVKHDSGRLVGSHREAPRDLRDSSDAVSAFIESERFAEVPYVYCGTRLAASLLSERTRHFRDSDYVDLRLTARALPYCDMMMVDTNLATRIRALRLDTRYGVQVFTARLPDYHAAAKWLRDRTKGAWPRSTNL